jgi:hypothetical protein
LVVVVPGVLFAFRQLIPTRGRKVLPASLPIQPSIKPAFLEITLLGMRNLTPSGLMKLQRPQV